MKTLSFQIKAGFYSLVLISFTFQFDAFSQQQDNKTPQIYQFSLDDLLTEDIAVASGVEENLFDAPASIVIINSEDIVQRGYTSLDEVLMDLPGFDITVSNGASYINAYQRGYRTSYTQRTLIMIDGKVDNHLWAQTALISRQYSMTNIKRIEVLYGPASAIYGPNAFLGIINVVTNDGKDLEGNSIIPKLSIQGGSFNTYAADLSVKGKKGELSYVVSGKIFKSDEPDLSDKWGFLSNDLYSSETLYGPLLNLENRGKKLGSYYDPSENLGLFARFNYKNFEFGTINWETKEGYGAMYAADRGQSNASWNHNSKQYYIQYISDQEKNIKFNILALYRENRIWGDWAEAEPDWGDSIIPNDTTIVGSDTTITENFRNYSYVSFTQWNTTNNSFLLKPNFEYDINEDIIFSGGLKFERKDLTKAYDVPGYWDGAFSSIGYAGGPYGLGGAIAHSSDPVYNLFGTPEEKVPDEDRTTTEDIGGFIQGIFNVRKFRFNLGLRVDNNSVYGSSVNPRISGIYKFSENGAMKIIYGEAFQEPGPIQLWGGWNGRNSNSDLKPEKVRNLELNTMLKTGNIFHDISIYSARYKNVIKEEAENAGTRKVFGLEYKARFEFENFISGSPKISGYFFYTYTKSKSSIHYNHGVDTWEEGETDLGDIAPSKINLGVNLPVKDFLNINLRGNYVSKRTLYSRNALRAQGFETDAFFVLNGNVNFTKDIFTVGFKILNILDKEYFTPGIEQAGSGNDFTQRSKGYRNSLIPGQGRSFMINLSLNINK